MLLVCSVGWCAEPAWSVADALVGYWKLDENAATATVVDSTETNNGSLNADATPSTTNNVDTTGHLGGGFVFDGVTNDYNVNMGDVLDFAYNEPFSLEAWVNYSTTDGTDRAIIGKMNVGGDNDGYIMYTTTSSHVSMIINGTGAIIKEASTTINDGKWHHLVMTYDGSASAAGTLLYVDGTSWAGTYQVHVDNLSAGATTDEPLAIGSLTQTDDTAERQWEGSIDNVRIYDREITSSEVTGLYNNGVGTTVVSGGPWDVRDAAVGYWPLDDDGGISTVTDKLGNYDGVLADATPTATDTSVISTTGAINKGLLFDAEVNDYHVNMGNILDFDYTDSFSFDFWASFGEEGPSAQQSIITKSDIDGEDSGYWIQLGTSEYLIFAMGDTTGTLGVRSTALYDDDVLRHFVITYDGSNTAAGMQYYVDGVPITEVSIVANLTGSITNTGDFVLGGIYKTSQWLESLEGILDNFRIYDRVLTPIEAAGLYNGGAGTVNLSSVQVNQTAAKLFDGSGGLPVYEYSTISIRSEAVGTDTGDGSNEITVTAPATMANGDYLVLIIGVGDEDPIVSTTATAPFPWTKVDSNYSASGNNIQEAIFYKYIVDYTAETTYTFTVGNADNAAWWIGSLSGIDASNPEDEIMSGNTINLDNNASPNAAEIFTTTDGAFVLAGWATNYDATVTLPEISDNFVDNSIDSVLWTTGANGSGTMLEQNQRMEFTLEDPTLSGLEYSEAHYTTNVDFTGVESSLETISVPVKNELGASFDWRFPSTSNRVRWHVYSIADVSTITAQRFNSDTPTDVWSTTWNATTYKWWRIRELDGIIYWDTSTDGIVWTNRASYAHSYTITSAEPVVGIFHENTASQVSSPTPFYWDNYTEGNTWRARTEDNVLTNIAMNVVSQTFPVAGSAGTVEITGVTSTEETTVGQWAFRPARTDIQRTSVAYDTFPSTPILDTFTRANEGPPPSSNWTPIFLNGAGGGLAVDTNVLAPTLTSDDNNAYWNASTFGPDSEIHCKISNIGATNDQIRLYLRMNNMVTDSSFGDGYSLYWDNLATDTLRLRITTAGSSTTLATFDQATASGDSIGLAAHGTTLIAWHKPSAGSWTAVGSYNTSQDTIQYNTSGSLLIDLNTGSAGVTMRVDDFGGGEASTTFNTATDYGISIRLENTGALDSPFYKWQYNLESGGWTDITTATPIYANTTSDFVHGADVPEYLNDVNFRKGITFDKVDDEIDCGTNDNILKEATAFSISAWIYPISSGENSYGRIISRDTDGDTAGMGLHLYPTDTRTGLLSYQVTGSTDMYVESAAGSIKFNQWNHVAVTTTGSATASNTILYINGIASTPSATQNGVSITDNSAATTRIGNRPDGERTFDGTISEVAVYDDVLTVAEVMDLAAGDSPLITSLDSLTSYWPLNDGTAGTSADADNVDDVYGNNNGTGDDGANNAGLAWAAVVDSKEDLRYTEDNNAALESSGGLRTISKGTDYTKDSHIAAAWLMSATSGTEPDVSANGGDLTEYSGTIPRSSDVPFGYNGTSRDFEAGDTEYFEHVDGNATDIYGADAQITLMTWIKPEQNVIGNMFGKMKNTDQHSFHFGRLAEKGLEARLCGDGTWANCVKFVTTGLVTDLDTWSHVALVSDDVDIRFYINGILANEPVAYTSGLYNNDAGVSIGRAQLATQDVDGLMTETAIFSRALTQEEIVEIMTFGLRGDGFNPARAVQAKIALPMKVDEDPVTDVSLAAACTGDLLAAGEPNYSTFAPFGYQSGSYLFDGTDDFITCGSDAGIDDFTNKTITAWVYAETLDPTGDGNAIVSKVLWDPTYTGWSFYADKEQCNGGTTGYCLSYWHIPTGGNMFWVTDDGTFSLNTWTHVAVSWTGVHAEDPSFYINGELVDTTMVVRDGSVVRGDAGANLNIGKRGQAGHLDDSEWDGYITELGYFKTVLSQEQIVNIMKYGLQGGLAANSAFESHLNFQIDAADVADENTIQLRMVYGDSRSGIIADGVDDYIDTNYEISLASDEDFSVSFWFQIDGTAASATEEHLLGVFGTTNCVVQVGFYDTGGCGADDGDTLQFYVQNASSSGDEACGNEVIVPGKWYHFAGVYDKSTGLYSYINGTLDDSDVSIASTGALSFGRDTFLMARDGGSGAENYIAGKIAEYYFWDNHVLTQAEVTTLATSSIAGAGLNIGGGTLAQYLPINDGVSGTSADGDTIKDMSGNAANAVGVDGANNTGLTWTVDNVLNEYNYLPTIIVNEAAGGTRRIILIQ